jgi:exonuclease III
MITLQEIWLESDGIRDDLNIPDYDLFLNSNGKGKGVATYFKKDIFTHDMDIKKKNMQLTKFTSPTLDVIALYRSQQGSQKELNHYIKQMETIKKPLLVVGDFNFCYLESSPNPTKHFLVANNFSQLIREPTHIEGNLLDQAYFWNMDGLLECSAVVHSKYYTDHKGLAITVKQSNITYLFNIS